MNLRRRAFPAWCIGVVSAVLACTCMSCSVPKPKDPSAFGAGVQCRDYPLTVGLPREERDVLRRASGRDLIIARYDGCRMRVLPGCSAKGDYHYTAMPVTEDHSTIGSRSLTTTTVGQFSTDEPYVYSAYLDGDCRGATHFVSVITIGAYEVVPAAPGVETEGDKALCLLARLDGGEAPARCDAPIRVELKALTTGIPKDAPGALAHDGWFMRAEVGGGYVMGDGAVRSEQVGTEDEFGKFTIKGASMVGTLSLGWTPFPGAAIGASVVQVYTPAANRRWVDYPGSPAEGDHSGRGATLIGPMLHWYPWVNDGFHLGIMGGGTLLQGHVNKTSKATGGGGLSLSTGYDFWVSKEWSLGFVARFTCTWFASYPEGPQSSNRFYTPSLGFAATYH